MLLSLLLLFCYPSTYSKNGIRRRFATDPSSTGSGGRKNCQRHWKREKKFRQYHRRSLVTGVCVLSRRTRGRCGRAKSLCAATLSPHEGSPLNNRREYTSIPRYRVEELSKFVYRVIFFFSAVILRQKLVSTARQEKTVDRSESTGFRARHNILPCIRVSAGARARTSLVYICRTRYFVVSAADNNYNTCL